MASFPAVTMTTEGLNMIAKASSGNSEDRLIVTKVKFGDGVSEGNIREYTDVISPKMEVTLAEWEDRGDGRFRYTFTYNNKGVKTGFYHREIGLFAKSGNDGGEKLIAYSNAGSYPGYIDDETKEIPYQRLMINIGVGDTNNVTGQVDVSNAVTIEMLDEHDADGNAHEKLIKKLFGSSEATLESVKEKVNEWSKEVCLSLSGGDITGDIIANNVYANNNILVFNNIEEMKASNKIKAGYTLRTQGFYTAGDGGGANYLVINNIDEEDIDEATLISLKKELYAKLLIEDHVNVKQFGAKGDGEADDTNCLQLCFNYVKDGCVIMPAGTYKTNDALIVDKGMKLFGYNATLKSYVDSTKCALVYSGDNNKGILEGLFIRCDNNGKACFDLKGVGGNLTLRNCQFMFGDYGLLADHMDASSANFLRMVNCVFTHNNKKAFMLGILSNDNFTTSCPISIIDCLVQSCGSITDIGENTDTVPIAVYRMLDVVIQRLQIDNHQHRYNYRIGEFNAVENLTIANLNVEDFPEDRTKDINLIELIGCINVNITNTKTWNIFPSFSNKPTLFRFNGCNGRHHAGIITDNANLSNYYSYGLNGNYINNDNWTSIYLEEDLLKCTQDIIRALAKPELTNICHCSNKSNAINNQSDNSSFDGTLPANGGSLDGGFFWRQNIHDDKCMAVIIMRCKGKAPDVDTLGRFVFEWYDGESSLLKRDMVTTGGTIQDNRGTWYKIHRSDAPEGSKMLRYGFVNSDNKTTYQFAGDGCINIYSWDVFMYYSRPIPNMPLVNGHVLNMY